MQNPQCLHCLVSKQLIIGQGISVTRDWYRTTEITLATVALEMGRVSGCFLDPKLITSEIRAEKIEKETFLLIQSSQNQLK